MRIGMAAIAAGVMIAAAGCGGSAEKDASLHAVWSSFDTVGQKAFCEAAIQDGENFYGPAMALRGSSAPTGSESATKRPHPCRARLRVGASSCSGGC